MVNNLFLVPISHCNGNWSEWRIPIEGPEVEWINVFLEKTYTTLGAERIIQHISKNFKKGE